MNRSPLQDTLHLWYLGNPQAPVLVGERMMRRPATASSSSPAADSPWPTSCPARSTRCRSSTSAGQRRVGHHRGERPFTFPSPSVL